MRGIKKWCSESNCVTAPQNAITATQGIKPDSQADFQYSENPLPGPSLENPDEEPCRGYKSQRDCRADTTEDHHSFSSPHPSKGGKNTAVRWSWQIHDSCNPFKVGNKY